MYIKQYKLSAPQLSFYVIYKIRENVMKDDHNYNINENIDFFVIYWKIPQNYAQTNEWSKHSYHNIIVNIRNLDYKKDSLY